MIQREEKRDRLIAKYAKKRESIKNDLRTTTSYREKIELIKKLENLPKNASPTRHRNRCWEQEEAVDFIVILDYRVMY